MVGLIKRYIIILLCLITALSVGGVYATWKYSESSPTPKEQNIGLSLSVFEYTPEEILPGGSENTGEVQLGQNHFAVVDLIVNSAGNGYSLNNSNSLLHNLLEDKPAVYSNQKTSGGNLKFILDPQNNTHNLYYCLQKVTDTLYYAYTFNIDDLSTAGGTDLEIPVYRTSIEKTDSWKATVSHIGYAKIVRLSDIGVSSASHTLDYSVDYISWHLQNQTAE